MVALAIGALVSATSCGFYNNDPPWECTVTQEGIDNRLQATSLEPDQIPIGAKIGQKYRPHSGCIPGDTYEHTP